VIERQKEPKKVTQSIRKESELLRKSINEKRYTQVKIILKDHKNIVNNPICFEEQQEELPISYAIRTRDEKLINILFENEVDIIEFMESKPEINDKDFREKVNEKICKVALKCIKDADVKKLERIKNINKKILTRFQKIAFETDNEKILKLFDFTQIKPEQLELALENKWFNSLNHYLLQNENAINNKIMKKIMEKPKELPRTLKETIYELSCKYNKNYKSILEKDGYGMEIKLRSTTIKKTTEDFGTTKKQIAKRTSKNICK